MKRRVIFIQIGSDDNRVFIMTVVFSIDIDTHLSPYIYIYPTLFRYFRVPISNWT